MAQTRLIPTGGTTGQVLSKVDSDPYDVEWTTPGAGAGITELTADVTAGPGTGSQAATVVAIRGRPVSNAAPGSDDVLAWDGAQWAPAAPGGMSEYQVRARALYGYR